MPILNICTYRVKPGKEAEMEKLLARHWPALHGAGLATSAKSLVYKAKPSGHNRHDVERTYIEIFEWADERSPGVAHQTPAVMAVWEPMGAICESMTFPTFEPLAFPYHRA